MDLNALEEIRVLKYRYLRSLDTKRWDEFAETLTDDVVGDYGSPSGGQPLRFDGRDALVGFMRNSLGPSITTVHVCTHPEIVIEGDEARGTWCMEDTVIAPEFDTMIRGAAYYNDRYRRENGIWRISYTGYERTYEFTMSLRDIPSLRLTANMWAKADS